MFHFYNYSAIALMLMILIESTVDGSELNKLSRKEAKQQDFVEGKNGLFSSRWDKDGNIVTENISENSINHSHKSQQDYVCGRAITNKKYKDMLLNDKGYQMSVSRTKYRPIEIRMPRIIGGDETEPGEFPWTVSVKLNDQPICGGSLIDKNWILTAAHCVVGYNPKNLTVRLGAYRIKDQAETQTIDIPVSMFIVHKEYSMPRPFSNDIALVKLNETVELTDYIIPICLPTEDQVSTSTSNVIVNDYSNRLGSAKEEASGIVISTKMSDHDIANCFSKLEQNYLNSIGLGSVADATTELPPVETSTSNKNRYAVDNIYMPSNDAQNNHMSSIHHHNKISFLQQYKPSGHYGAPLAIDTNSLINSYENQNEYVYYTLPWAGKSNMYPNGFRRDKIKLSRLPISKELLSEIQSIGSGPMPSLNLGLHRGDFVAMASDLTEGSSIGSTTIAATSSDSSSSSSNRDMITNFSNKNLIRTMENEESDDPTKYSGLSGIVVGWGWIREVDGEDHVNNKGYPSVTLQKVKLPILRNNICEAWFQSQSKKITLLPSQFCAGFNSGGKDACRGDSGGPMIIEDNSDTGRYKLIGIVSAGIGCARPSLPGLYTRVASFIPWINAQMLRN